MTAIILDDGWTEAARILGISRARIDRAIDRSINQEARFLQRKIKEGLRQQAPGGQRFRPLSPLTIAVRRFQRFGGTKALIVRGDLRNSIKVVKAGSGRYFIGVLRQARGRNGQSLFNVAQVHEFGSRPIVLQVTKKMRGFLAKAFTEAFGSITPGGGGFSTGIIVTRIPARPFIRPVFERFARPDDIKDRFTARFTRLLGGDFGLTSGL